MSQDPRVPPHVLDPAQLGVHDMDPEAFRKHGYAVIDWIADYLAQVDEHDVLATVEPGQIRNSLPQSPPSQPEPFAQILEDLDTKILPGITHWNHPAFHAYFAITGSGPGILGETISATLNVNAMLWRTSPSATELESLTLDWLRQLLGLQAPWHGIICDTASMSTMLALAAARERTDLDVRERGLAGRPDVPLLRVYTSEQAHSSVEKAAITLGLGRDGVRIVPTDERLQMRPDALAEAMREDVRFGYRPIAIVPTVGTTSTTSIDPVAAIADVRDELVKELGYDVWLHVDGAYGAMAAICEEHREILDGVDRADSFVTNPHKWLFTPIDCSALYVKDPATLIGAFALVPEYLRTDEDDVVDYMNWGVQLGRRFRALKLWFVLRYFGAEGLAARIRTHLEQAQTIVSWVRQHPHLTLAADAQFSTVCFRAHGITDVDAEGVGADDGDANNEFNRQLLARVNASGKAYLSHTMLGEQYVLRLAVGNLRTDQARIEQTLQLIDHECERLHQSF